MPITIYISSYSKFDYPLFSLYFNTEGQTSSQDGNHCWFEKAQTVLLRQYLRA